MGLYRWIPSCDTHECCGNCDGCTYNNEEIEDEIVEIGEEIWKTKKKETQER